MNNSQSIDFLGLSSSISSNKVENVSNQILGDIFNLNISNNNNTNNISQQPMNSINQMNSYNLMNPMLLTNYGQPNTFNQMPVYNYQTTSPIYSGVQISLS
jgi:hypothetical protein